MYLSKVVVTGSIWVEVNDFFSGGKDLKCMHAHGGEGGCYPLMGEKAWHSPYQGEVLPPRQLPSYSISKMLGYFPRQCKILPPPPLPPSLPPAGWPCVATMVKWFFALVRSEAVVLLGAYDVPAHKRTLSSPKKVLWSGQILRRSPPPGVDK